MGASLLASRRKGRTQRASRLAPPSRTSPTRARRFARDLLRERRANFRRNAATLVRDSVRKRWCRASTPQVTHMCTKSTVWYHMPPCLPLAKGAHDEPSDLAGLRPCTGAVGFADGKKEARRRLAATTCDARPTELFASLARRPARSRDASRARVRRCAWERGRGRASA